MGNTIKARVVNNTGNLPIPAPKVAIVDNFDTKIVCVDNDEIPDVAHGNVVKRFIQEGLPTANIECFNVPMTNGRVRGADLNRQLGNLLTKIDSGEKYQALNFSQGSYFDYEEISKILGKKITPQNLAKYKNEIREALTKDYKIDDGAYQLKTEFDNLDKIASKGVPIYVAAGNVGNSGFNVYSLVQNVNSVGALENNNKADFSADNSTVNKWANGVFKITPKMDSKGASGFDYTGDGSVDIIFSQVSTQQKLSNDDGLWGTSFSTPNAIVQDLKKKKQKNR